MVDYNPDHYTTPRISGLRREHFRRRRSDAIRPVHIVIVIVAAAATVAASLWLGWSW